MVLNFLSTLSSLYRNILTPISIAAKPEAKKDDKKEKKKEEPKPVEEEEIGFDMFGGDDY